MPPKAAFCAPLLGAVRTQLALGEFFKHFLIVAFVPLPGGRQHHWEGKRAANPPPRAPPPPARPPPSAAALTPLLSLLHSQKGESVKKMREEVSFSAGAEGGLRGPQRCRP